MLGVVVVAINISADAVSIVVPDAGAGGRRAGAVAIGIDDVIDGCCRHRHRLYPAAPRITRVVIVTIHIATDAIAIVVADAGAEAVGVPAQLQFMSRISLMVVLSPSLQAAPGSSGWGSLSSQSTSLQSAIAIVIANSGAGGRCTDAITVDVNRIINGSVIAIITEHLRDN